MRGVQVDWSIVGVGTYSSVTTGTQITMRTFMHREDIVAGQQLPRTPQHYAPRATSDTLLLYTV